MISKPSQQLSRNLVLLLAVQTFVLLPYFTIMPPWIAGFSVALIALKAYLHHYTLSIGKAFKALLAVTGFTMVLLTFGKIYGQQGGTALLIVTLGLKLHETTTSRDFFVWLYTNYFLTAATFLSSQSIPFALYMATNIVLLTTCLLRCTQSSSLPQRHLFKDIKIVGRSLAYAAPIAVIFFILFPRLPGPLWSLPNDSATGMTGISDSMSPGNISQLLQNNATAFRVDFITEAPTPENMYWRGPVLWDFDGRQWKNASRIQQQKIRPTQGAQTIDYEIVLEPHPESWIYGLDWPFQTNARQSKITRDGQVLTAQSVSQRIRYEGKSVLPGQMEFSLTENERIRALSIPADKHPQTRVLSEQWANEYGQDSVSIVNAALRYFNQQPFSYTLQPTPLGADTIDSFLFDTREGFCEYYASSFTVLMRLAGIPARVVTGFQGAEHNPNDDYYIVRYADAHAWSEVWFDDRGWVRIDPTAAVSPDRVRLGIVAALGDSESLPLFIRQDISWLRDARLRLDAINHAWNRWIIGYNQSKQLSILKKLGIDSWRKMGVILALMFITTIAILTFILLRNVRKRPPSLGVMYFSKIRSVLEKKGIDITLQDTPTSLYHKVAKNQPAMATDMQHFTSLLNKALYGKAIADESAMKEALKGSFRTVERALNG